MVTHSGILACTEEPSRLQSMGSRRVGYNWVTDTEWPSGFTCFLQFKCEFCKENSWSEPQSVPGHVKTTLTLWSFSIFGCKEYNQSDFGVDHLVMSMCRVFSCGWKRVFAMTSAFSLQNSISLCPASFRIPRPNLPVTPGVSWLPTFAFQSPIMKRTSF